MKTVGVLRGTDPRFYREGRQPSLAAKSQPQRAGFHNAGDVPVNAALTEGDHVAGDSAHPGEISQDAPSVSVDQALLEKVRAIKDRVAETAE